MTIFENAIANMKLLDNLIVVVQMRVNRSYGWETIAAFNSENVAAAYAKRCNDAAQQDYEYRTWPLTGDNT